MNIMKQQETTLVQRACAKVAGFKALHKRAGEITSKNCPTQPVIKLAVPNYLTLHKNLEC